MATREAADSRRLGTTLQENGGGKKRNTEGEKKMVRFYMKIHTKIHSQPTTIFTWKHFQKEKKKDRERVNSYTLE